MSEKKKFLRILIGGLVINLLLMVIAGSFHLFFIRPTHTELSEAKKTLASLEKKEVTIFSLGQEVQKRSDDIQRLDDSFLNPGDVISLVTLLESVAARSNTVLTIRAASIDEVELIEKKSTFDILVTGTFTNIITFITFAENLPYFTDISSLIISTQGNELRAQLQLTVLTL
jgi:hypothetical protein